MYSHDVFTLSCLVFQMAQLNPESMSMIGLNLFQQLSHLSRIANASCENPLLEDQVSNNAV